MQTLPAEAIQQWTNSVVPRLKFSRSGTFHRLQQRLGAAEVEQVLRAAGRDLERMQPQLADALGIHKRLAADGFLEVGRLATALASSGQTVTVFISIYVQPAVTRSTVAAGSLLQDVSYPHAVVLEGFIPDQTGTLKDGYLFASKDGMSLELTPLADVSALEDAHFLNPFVPTASTADTTRIEELSMRLISGATTGMRRKTVEAHDVSAAISSLGLHQTVPGTMRTRQPLTRGLGSAVYVMPQKHTVRVGSSRVPEAKLIQWFANCVAALQVEAKATKLSNQLLAQMAKRTDMAKLTPVSFQLDYAVLREEGYGEEFTWKAGTDADAVQTEEQLLDAFDVPIDLLPSTVSPTALGPTGTRTFEGKIPTSPALTLRLEVSSDSCQVRSPTGARLGEFVDKTGASEPFLDFVNRLHAMRVSFTGATALYSADGAYASGDVQVAVDQLISFLTSTKDLDGVTSEKGDEPAGFAAYPQESSFRRIEDSGDIAKAASALICGDDRKEIFDYLEISVAERRTRWLHAKMTSGKAPDSPGSLSASALQEAVGQAQKNLAFIRMSSSDKRFTRRDSSLGWQLHAAEAVGHPAGPTSGRGCWGQPAGPGQIARRADG
ncbi:hypothetical protein [Mitsuaria sp. 7]|uniref:hypothetical protein n=1 Tax=Mitsuaria sp. 7 TaxID=1658665 RepID=UPI0012F713A4|nr:hypothetical protein [Mitsuaria sp. 7]